MRGAAIRYQPGHWSRRWNASGRPHPCPSDAHRHLSSRFGPNPKPARLMTGRSKVVLRRMERSTSARADRGAQLENILTDKRRTSPPSSNTGLKRNATGGKHQSSPRGVRDAQGACDNANGVSELVLPKLSRREILLRLRQDRAAGNLNGARDRLPLSEARQIFVDVQPSHNIPTPHLATHRRKKVSIIAWDVAHNPLGRAYVLADALKPTTTSRLLELPFRNLAIRCGRRFAKAKYRLGGFADPIFPITSIGLMRWPRKLTPMCSLLASRGCRLSNLESQPKRSGIGL